MKRPTPEFAATVAWIAAVALLSLLLSCKAATHSTIIHDSATVTTFVYSEDTIRSTDTVLIDTAKGMAIITRLTTRRSTSAATSAATKSSSSLKGNKEKGISKHCSTSTQGSNPKGKKTVSRLFVLAAAAIAAAAISRRLRR